jgi:hypothetical protein
MFRHGYRSSWTMLEPRGVQQKLMRHAPYCKGKPHAMVGFCGVLNP